MNIKQQNETKVFFFLSEAGAPPTGQLWHKYIKMSKMSVI